MDECNDKTDVEADVQGKRIERFELRRIYSQLFQHPRNKLGPTSGGFAANLKSVGAEVKGGNRAAVNALLTQYHDEAEREDPGQVVLNDCQWVCLEKAFTCSEFKVLRAVEGAPGQPQGDTLKVGPYELAFLYHCLFRAKGVDDEMHEVLHRMKFSVVTGGDYVTVIRDELTRVYNDHSPAGELVKLDFTGTGIIEAMAMMLKDRGFRELEPYEGHPCKDMVCY